MSTKHYEELFLDHLADGERILDIICSYEQCDPDVPGSDIENVGEFFIYLIFVWPIYLLFRLLFVKFNINKPDKIACLTNYYLRFAAPDNDILLRRYDIDSLTTSTINWKRIEFFVICINNKIIDKSLILYVPDKEEGKSFYRLLHRWVANTDNNVISRPISIELRNLYSLKNEGILTNEEWDRAKRLYLGKPEEKRDMAISLIRKFHALYKSNALSEGEYNEKKWDILSRNL